MEDLVNWMTLDNPAKRPQIEEVLEMFALIRVSMSQSKLRSPITSRKVPKFFRVIQQARQSLRTMQYVVSCRPAIPDPVYPHVSRAATLWTIYLLLYFSPNDIHSGKHQYILLIFVTTNYCIGRRGTLPRLLLGFVRDIAAVVVIRALIILDYNTPTVSKVILCRYVIQNVLNCRDGPLI